MTYLKLIVAVIIVAAVILVVTDILKNQWKD